MKFTYVFFFIFLCCICSVFPSNAETDFIVELEILNGHLMTSCVRECSYQKILKSHYRGIFLQVTINNAKDVFWHFLFILMPILCFDFPI